MKELEKLKARESTTRDEIYPCGDVIFAVLIDDVKNAKLERTLGIVAAGKFVSNDPLPINLPKTDPVEIVEKNPYVVDIEATEILLAVMKFVDILLTERPFSIVVPPVCVMLLEAVRSLPKSSVPTNRFVI
jgi:hypothetical protein